jgi:hypothetical protein
MRKLFLVLMVFVMVLPAAGCGQPKQISFDFTASDVEDVELYYYADVPARSQMKTVTDSADIQSLMDAFSAMKVKNAPERKEGVAGGGYFAAKFNLSGARAGDSYDIIYLEAYREIEASYGFDYVTDADVMGLWEEYGHEIQNIPDSLLPSFALPAYQVADNKELGCVELSYDGVTYRPFGVLDKDFLDVRIGVRENGGDVFVYSIRGYDSSQWICDMADSGLMDSPMLLKAVGVTDIPDALKQYKEYDF